MGGGGCVCAEQLGRERGAERTQPQLWCPGTSAGTQNCPRPLLHPPNCTPPGISGKPKPKGLCWGCAIPQGPQPAPGGVQAPPKCNRTPGVGETSLWLGSSGCGGPRAAPGPTCSCSAACGSHSSAAAAASPAWWWTRSSPAAASRCATSGSAPAPRPEGSIGVSSRGHTAFPVSPGSRLPGTQPRYLCTLVH